MKTKNATRVKATPERLTRNGRRLIVLEEAEYDRLRLKADEWEPLLPEPNADGNYPALEAPARVPRPQDHSPAPPAGSNASGPGPAPASVRRP